MNHYHQYVFIKITPNHSATSSRNHDAHHQKYHRSINRPKMQAWGSLQGSIVRHEPLPARTASKRCPICRISMSNIYRRTPHAYNVATKLFRNDDHEKLVDEATIFANRLAVRLRRIYADAGRGKAFIHSGIHPVETRPNILCSSIWLLVIAISVLAAIIFRTTESISSSFSKTSFPRPLSPERAVILKEFQVARKDFPSLAVKLTSTPTGAPLSSRPILEESTEMIVFLTWQIIGVFPTYFTQVDNFMQMHLRLGTKIERTRVRDIQIRARKPVMMTTQMQPLLTRLTTDLVAARD
ncbi:MAG: hypothetical protein Q9198_007721 [Flavoplaca austrocitrina]